MKFQTTAIAMAVAGTVAAPVAVQADPMDIYASVRIGIWSGDIVHGEDNTQLRSFSSRFGVKAETDLGNGMTGFGRYEWDVDFNNDDPPTTAERAAGAGDDEDDISVRQRIVGVKGDFGKITLGQTYHTFYNYVVGPTDTPWWHSDYAMIEYRGRTDDALSYNYDAGGFSFGVSLYMFREDGVAGEPSDLGVVPADPGVKAKPHDEEAIDQIEIGASFPIGDMTLGFALLTTEADSVAGTGREIGNGSDEDVIGIALTGISLGDVSLGFSFQSQDEDTGFVADIKLGNAYLYVEAESLDKASIANTIDQDRTLITLGYTQTLGKDTLIYYEIFSQDNDGVSTDDITQVMAVLKYNLI